MAKSRVLTLLLKISSQKNVPVFSLVFLLPSMFEIAHNLTTTTW